MSLETSPEVAARQIKPLRGELLPWDERVLKISSPSLIQGADSSGAEWEDVAFGD